MDTGRPILFLIDAYSLLFRAHLAYSRTEGLRTSDGRPTGALHGFASMLLSILSEKPDAIYVAWDAPGPTFRDELFKDYKAHRPEPDPELKAQFEPARQLVQAFGIPSAEVPGFEADDLVGTLAEEGRRSGYEVVIYTGDSDQLQLVREGVTVRMTGRGVSETTDYDADRVCSRYGVRPDQFADFKALVGDASDNIPGVPGVGEKTAADLLQQWGDIETLLQHVEDLPEDKATKRKVKEALRANADQLRLARELTRIRCDAPVTGPLQRYAPTPQTWSEVRRLFASLEFRKLADRLPAPAAETEVAKPQQPLPQLRWQRTGSDADLNDLLLVLQEAPAFAARLHVEGDTPLASRLLGIAVATAPDRAWYLPIADRRQSPTLPGLDTDGAGFAVDAGALARVLDGPARLLGHDTKRDLEILAAHGFERVRFDFDTALAGYLLAPGGRDTDLTRLAERHLAVAVERPASEAEGLCREAAWIVALEPILAESLREDGLERVFREIEMPLVPVLADMERRGVMVDCRWLEHLSTSFERELDDISEQVFRIAGRTFQISSTQQLQKVLFDELQLPAGKRTKTGRTTSADHLEALASEYPIARMILRHRELTKLKSTYADALPKLIRPETGRLHTSLNQMVTSTGRLSSSDPNLQNIPVRSEEGRQIRRAFVAPSGMQLLSCDYSQIELRVFAHVTGDTELVRAFEADEDIHTATATKLFGVPADQVTPEMRRRAKTVNFAVIYGQSPFGLAQTLGIPVEEARSFIHSYFEQFPGVREWTARTLEEARARGYVETLIGRRRYLPELRSTNRVIREAAERAAVNMPIQGTAADIMKLAMLAVWSDQQQNNRPWNLVLQVHDELLIEAKEHSLDEAVSVVTNLMESAYRLRVRLKVDAKAGRNWADMEPVRAAR